MLPSEGVRLTRDTAPAATELLGDLARWSTNCRETLTNRYLKTNTSGWIVAVGKCVCVPTL